MGGAATRDWVPVPGGHRRQLGGLIGKLQDQYRRLRAASGLRRASADEWLAAYRQVCAGSAVLGAMEKDLQRGGDPLLAACKATSEAIDVADDPRELFRCVQAALAHPVPSGGAPRAKTPRAPSPFGR